MRRRARRLMIDRGEILRLGSRSLLWGDKTGLAMASRALVDTSLVNLPVETGRRWLAAAGIEVGTEPEWRLLSLAVDVAVDPTSSAIDAEADEVVADFVARSDVGGAVTAYVLAMTVAHRRGDLGRVLTLLEDARRVLGDEDSPTMQLAFRSGDATLAYLADGADAALEILDEASFVGASGPVADLAKVLRANWLLEAGRASEALHVITSVEAPDASVDEYASYIRWHAGGTGAMHSPPDLGDMADLSDTVELDARRSFIRCFEIAVIAASLGEGALARAAQGELAAQLGPRGGALFSGSAAAALATVHVLDGDDGAARSILDRHLAAFPIDDPIGDAQLRRCLAVGYVVHDRLRAWWDDAALGPTHQKARSIARMLLDARGRRLDRNVSLGEPGPIVAALPLPWSVELAVAARQVDVPGWAALIDELAKLTLGPLRSELRSLVAGSGGDGVDDEGDVGPTVSLILAELPREGGPALRIDVLGPLAVHLSGEPVNSPELRRARVREVLALLVVRGSLRRDELIELLWPDRDPHRSRQNLRTTLTYLRRVLEPDADDGEGETRLHTDGGRVALAGPTIIDVDLWTFRRLVSAADGGPSTAASGSIELLREAIGLWRGDPVADLADVIDVEADVQQIRSELVEAGLRLGELHLAAGRFDEAVACVDRVCQAAPYSERAHRLAVAALVQTGDRQHLRLRVDQLNEMLADLEVEPEAATAMLLSRAGTVLGTLDPDHRRHPRR